MKKLIGICAVVLVVQVGLAVLTNWRNPGGEGKGIAKGPLLQLAAAEVDEVLLEDGTGQKIALKKNKERWQLPAQGNFPADSVRIQGMIERVAGMQRGWPEAATAEAAVRFKVDVARFERKMTLKKGGAALGTVYFGTSPGLRKIYCRVDGDKEIQAFAMATDELDMKLDNWIDTGMLHLKVEQIHRVNLPGISLVRQGKDLIPSDLKNDEEVAVGQRDAAVKRIAGLTITSLLEKGNKPEYGLEHPALHYTVEMENGTRIEYVFGQLAQAAQATPEKPAGEVNTSSVLQVSGQERLFRLESWQVEELLHVSRASLVRTKEAAEKEDGAKMPPAPAGTQASP